MNRRFIKAQGGLAPKPALQQSGAGFLRHQRMQPRGRPAAAQKEHVFDARLPAAPQKPFKEAADFRGKGGRLSGKKGQIQPVLLLRTGENPAVPALHFVPAETGHRRSVSALPAAKAGALDLQDAQNHAVPPIQQRRAAAGKGRQGPVGAAPALSKITAQLGGYGLVLPLLRVAPGQLMEQVCQRLPQHGVGNGLA